MQLNIVLYAIKNCTNKEQEDRIRNYYQLSDLNYDSLKNKENLEQMFQNLSYEHIVSIEPKKLWNMFGSVGGIKSSDLQVTDTNVIAACFAAQALWITEKNQQKQENIELVVRSGRTTNIVVHVSSDIMLKVEQIIYMSEIESMLRSDPSFEFRVFWGFIECCKLQYIFSKDDTEKEKYEKYAFVSSQH
jgi:hypothetical protein